MSKVQLLDASGNTSGTIDLPTAIQPEAYESHLYYESDGTQGALQSPFGIFSHPG
jgi:hypothetical protein